MPITCSRLSFCWPDGTVVLDELTASIGPGRTGLVAPNGAGKTTLLRLVAGLLTPTGGTVTVAGALGYLPQTLPFDGRSRVCDVLGVTEKLAALDALAAGDVRDEVFAAIGEDWEIAEHTAAELDRLGLGGLAPDRPLAGLSGGEVVLLGLAGRLLARPDVLLLDEPSNNLDAAARRRLYRAVEEYRGTLLVASHDRDLLDRMDRIAELHRGRITWYGGNFTAYREAVRAARAAAEAQVRAGRRELDLHRRQRQQARERAARRAGAAARRLPAAGLPKIVAGAMKRRAQESAGRIDDVHEERIAAARQRLRQAEARLRDDDAIVVDLPDTAVPAGRLLVRARAVRYRIGDRELFAGNGFDLDIGGPERIALTGGNGAGKSTLLRLLAGVLTPHAGEIRRVDGRIAYLSQRLDLLDERAGVAEQLAAAAPAMSPTRRRHLLAHFGFDDRRSGLPVSALSGGERLRATLVCVLFAEPAPQLLLLDEPTNNLDLDSVAVLESALTGYRGAFVVVSHDTRFLDALRIDRRLVLAEGRLRDGELRAKEAHRPHPGTR